MCQCDECTGGDAPEMWEPAEDDDYITDVPGGYQVSHDGKYLGTFERETRAVAALYLARERGNYWPNIWAVNDHGNVTLCVFNGHKLEYTDCAYV